MANPSDLMPAGASASDTWLRFWTWWTTRLTECLPSGLRAWLAGDARLPVIDLSGGALNLWSASNLKTPQQRFAVDFDKANNPSQLAAMLRPLAALKGGLIVAAGEANCLRRELTLPLAAQANLRQTISYDLDRLTPFASDQVLFDAQVKSVDHSRRQLTVQFVASPKSAVSTLLQACKEAGLTVARVVPSATQANDWARLAAPGSVASKRPWFRRAWPWCLAIFIALLALSLLFPLWQKRQRVIATHDLVVTAQKDATAAELTQRDVVLRSTQYNTLLAKRHSTPLAIQLLDEVTRKVPDDTWVQNFELRTTKQARELMLVGDTNSSSKIISWFEGSPLFAQATFKSPLTRNPAAGPNAERFQVALEVKTVPLPSPVSVLDAPPKVEPKPEPKEPAKAPPPPVKGVKA
jgi:general secretion pathway protein L